MDQPPALPSDDDLLDLCSDRLVNIPQVLAQQIDGKTFLKNGCVDEGIAAQLETVSLSLNAYRLGRAAPHVDSYDLIQLFGIPLERSCH